MGRIKTALVKRVTRELLKAHRNQFSSEFVKNKEVVNSIANMPSKKIRNVVAGYLTRLKRSEQV